MNPGHDKSDRAAKIPSEQRNAQRVLAPNNPPTKTFIIHADIDTKQGKKAFKHNHEEDARPKHP